MTDVLTVVADLLAEGDDLFATLASLPDSAWSRPTPAPGWTIALQRNGGHDVEVAGVGGQVLGEHR